MERHLHELECYGFTVVPDALPQPLLGRVQAAFDQTVARLRRRGQLTQFGGSRAPGASVDFAQVRRLPAGAHTCSWHTYSLAHVCHQPSLSASSCS
jgi:hypothetical protein